MNQRTLPGEKHRAKFQALYCILFQVFAGQPPVEIDGNFAWAENKECNVQNQANKQKDTAKKLIMKNTKKPATILKPNVLVMTIQLVRLMQSLA